MQQRLTPGTALLLTVPPLLWAGNAVVGRLVRELVSPHDAELRPLAAGLRAAAALRGAPCCAASSPLWMHWKRFAVLGLLGIGCYNAFQYLALQTSTPINVTLVGSSMPLWMLATGTLFFGARVTRREHRAAPLLSMLGVLLVLSRGEWSAAARAAAGAGRSLHDAGDHLVGVLQLDARAHPRARRPCGGTGPPS